MAQKAIREYDAKCMWYAYKKQMYTGTIINNKSELDDLLANLEQKSDTASWVVKPDQLFGKRGKLGLLGISLTSEEVVSWIKDHWHKETEIDTSTGVLHTFLVEPFVPHEKEWYIAIKTNRDGDVLHFSHEGGIEVEENWDTVISLHIPVLETLEEATIIETFGELPKAVVSFVHDLFGFFRDYGFSYLEVNPFVLDATGNVVCLDMVAKVDTAEEWKQRSHWKHISRVKPFGSVTHPLEATIEKMDAETGASLKFSTLDPKGTITLLLGGGGASVLTMDKLGDMGLLNQTVNYGELSGNPNYRHNKAYVQGLIDIMCENQHKKQRLCLIGGIANFTKIDVLAKAFVDALEERVGDIKQSNIHILVRRGGVNDKKGLALIKAFCNKNGIPCSVADGDTYLTTAIEALQA